MLFGGVSVHFNKEKKVFEQIGRLETLLGHAKHLLQQLSGVEKTAFKNDEIGVFGEPNKLLEISPGFVAWRDGTTTLFPVDCLKIPALAGRYDNPI
jgi:hypothetical protein